MTLFSTKSEAIQCAHDRRIASHKTLHFIVYFDHWECDEYTDYEVVNWYGVATVDDHYDRSGWTRPEDRIEYCTDPNF